MQDRSLKNQRRNRGVNMVMIKQKMFSLSLVLCLVLTGLWFMPAVGENENDIVVEDVNDVSLGSRSGTRNTLYVGPGQTYSEILNAVENASTGDTIRVYTGTYTKGFILSKRLTIIGNGSENTILDLGKIGNSIGITADNCVIQGLNIYGYNYQKSVNVVTIDSNFNQIKNCFIHSNKSCYALDMGGSNNNTISNCTLTKNFYAVHAWNVNDNIFENNLIKGNDYSFSFSNANRNKILNCELISNKDWGIVFSQSSSNDIINTYLYSNTNGLSFSQTQNNRIINVTNENDKNSGIYIASSKNTLIKNSRFLYSGYVGCRVVSRLEISSENNEIKDCLFVGNQVTGVHLESETINNVFYNNTFLNNGQGSKGDGHQGIDDGTNNKWDNGTTGNHWSDWITPDNDDDGIVDNPYKINGTAGAKDNYPLVSPTHSVSTNPIITTANINKAYAGSKYSVFYKATDSDTPANLLSWGMDTNASWLKFSSEQELFGTPKYSDVGKYWVYISVSDGNNIDSTNFTLTVIPDPNATVKNIRTGNSYYKIQDAIDNASSGDTLRLAHATFYENIIIDKTLTIRGMGVGNSTIDASNWSDTLTILADNCKLEKLTITGAEQNPLVDCICGSKGIVIKSNNNVIVDCTVTSSEYGFHVSGNNTKIWRCNISFNWYAGVYLYNSNDNSILNCILDQNGQVWDGSGIYSYNSNNNFIANSQLSSNIDYGIAIHGSNNDIDNCTIEYNRKSGIYLISQSNNNNITNNNIIKNHRYGVSVRSNCSNNFIQNNNFINNSIGVGYPFLEAEDWGSDNRWNTSESGNYWSNWTGPDKNNDGIVDIPRNISGSAGAKDYKPLAKPAVKLPEKPKPPKPTIGRVIIERTGEQFTKIQDAIDNATSGDTVRVWAGTYDENIVINNKLNLIGNGSANTIIDAKTHSSVISISSEAGCKIKGFNITGGELNGNFSSIHGSTGVWIQADKVKIEDCEINDVYEGIEIRDSTKVTVTNCKIFNNRLNGIYLYESQYNMISNNNIHNNGHSGIYLWISYNNNIENCTMVENDFSGLIIWNSDQNEIKNCDFDNNYKYGIELQIDNGSKWASTENNTIILNNFLSNYNYGVSIDPKCNNNMIYHNNFIGNAWAINWTWLSPQANDDGSNNKWDFSSEGNYWSDWTSPDNNSDGIVDLPYKLDGSAGAKDHYPLTKKVDIWKKPQTPGNDTVLNVRTQVWYRTISKAVAEAKAGDTIKVFANTYIEDVLITKPLTLEGDEGKTILQANNSIALEIRSVNTTVSGFTIQNSSSGILLDGWIWSYYSFDININKCIFVNNKIGLRTMGERGFKIFGCTFRTNKIGVHLANSSNGRINECVFDQNTGYAINILMSNKITIWNNTFTSNNGVTSKYNSSICQARDDFIYFWQNYWNSSSGFGNYWSDWTSPDKNNDGIVDLPYNISGSAGAKDYYPLTEKVDIKPEPPKVTNTNIAHNSYNISVNTSEIIITFSQPMNTTLVEASLKILPTINYTLKWEKNNTVLRIIFNDKLSYNTTYKISFDLDSEGVDSPFELVFTTEPKEDNGNGEDQPKNGTWSTVIIYMGVISVIVILLFLVTLAFVTKNRRKRSEELEQRHARLETGENGITSSNGTAELLTELKSEALAPKKKSSFGPSESKMLNKLDQKYKNGKLSKETYDMIKDSIMENNQKP